jgi:Ca-activated chloride channel family protein
VSQFLRAGRHRLWVAPIFCFVALFGYARQTGSQTSGASAEAGPQYRLSVSVDEVMVSFHAAGADGRSVDDLGLDELNLLDNGRPPLKVLQFESVKDIPLRVGLLIDMSESMDEARSRDRAAAIRFVQHLFRRNTDEAFVLNFGRRPVIVQTWTNDPSSLMDGILNHRIVAGGGGRNDGTAVIDAVYRACVDQFSQTSHESNVNFLILFSDGEDNASHYSLQDAVGACQHANTAVFAFRTEAEPGFSSDGPKILADLATQTGGRVFRDQDSEAEAYANLQAIQADVRSRYRLIYRPADLKRDGSFHRITLAGPQRVASIDIRSGYYAPAQ